MAGQGRHRIMAGHAERRRQWQHRCRSRDQELKNAEPTPSDGQTVRGRLFRSAIWSRIRGEFGGHVTNYSHHRRSLHSAGLGNTPIFLDFFHHVLYLCTMPKPVRIATPHARARPRTGVSNRPCPNTSLHIPNAFQTDSKRMKPRKTAPQTHLTDSIPLEFMRPHPKPQSNPRLRRGSVAP